VTVPDIACQVVVVPWPKLTPGTDDVDKFFLTPFSMAHRVKKIFLTPFSIFFDLW